MYKLGLICGGYVKIIACFTSKYGPYLSLKEYYYAQVTPRSRRNKAPCSGAAFGDVSYDSGGLVQVQFGVVEG